MNTWPIIADRLYVVGFVEADWPAFAALKVDVVIDMAGELAGVPRGTVYVSYPIQDLPTWWGDAAGRLGAAAQQLNPKVLDAMAAAAVAMMRRGHVVAVACMAGMNRSALLAALIVRHYLGVSGVKAVSIVRAGRPGALTNDSFVSLVAGMETP